ncbi:circadian clock-controlled protein [Clostridium neonatale]|uniref:circadian clock-controlled protein n=1 Tax=Clostridium neonatale TaxID=137838 RepID=UPI00291BEC1F|nr:conserved hypothetical protein [Clostridium neonatale]
MARKISISFKETKKDIELFNILMELDDKSSDIKKILREYYTGKQSKDSKEFNKEKSENINILNF